MVSAWLSSSRALALQTADEQARQQIGEKRNDKDDQPRLQKRRQEESRRRLAELIGDDTGERIARVEEAQARLAGLIANHHRDGHGLTQSTPQGQDHATNDPNAR